MKKAFLAITTLCSLSSYAQPGKGKEMKMTPSFSPGYYISLKGDTVKGEVQNNRDFEYDNSLSLFFRIKSGSKPMEYNTKKAKGYGFDNNHYTSLKMDDKDVYIKILETGRLNLFEYKYADAKGPQGVGTVYFIVDSRAAENDKAGTNILTQLDEMSFKKQLKPFFKDQPIVLEPVDKWKLKIEEIRKAVVEFNGMYP